MMRRFYILASQRGFTLIETLVAVSLLTASIVAPMALTGKSLAAAYYARDQVTAFHLAQEAIESVRHVRDHNILLTALGTPTDLLTGIPSTSNEPFIVDTRNDEMELCGATCPPLQLDSAGELYGYRPSCAMPTTNCGESEGWTNSRFTRTVRAEFVGGGTDEVRISVTVSWQTGSFQTRQFVILENLYRWVNDTTS